MGSPNETHASGEQIAPSSGRSQVISKLLNVYDGLKKSSTPSDGAPAMYKGKVPKPTAETRRAPVPNSSESSTSKKRKSKPGESRQDSKKRFLWTNKLHRAFIEAVFDIGLRQAKPRHILSMMEHKPECITTENVKSHLRRYRIHAEKFKGAFLRQFDIAKLQVEELSDGKAVNPGFHAYPFPIGIFPLDPSGPLPLRGEIMSPVYALDDTRSEAEVSDAGSKAEGESWSRRRGRARQVPKSDSHAPAAESSSKAAVSSPSTIPDVLEQMEVQMRIHQQIQEHHDIQRHRHQEPGIPGPGELPAFPSYKRRSYSVEDDDFDDLFDFLQ